MRIGYHGLPELAAADGLWAGAPVLAEAPPERRETVLRAITDHLRGVLVLDMPALTEERTRSLGHRVAQSLREPWTFDEGERLRLGKVALLPGATADPSRPVGGDAPGSPFQHRTLPALQTDVGDRSGSARRGR